MGILTKQIQSFSFNTMFMIATQKQFAVGYSLLLCTFHGVSAWRMQNDEFIKEFNKVVVPDGRCLLAQSQFTDMADAPWSKYVKVHLPLALERLKGEALHKAREAMTEVATDLRAAGIE